MLHPTIDMRVTFIMFEKLPHIAGQQIKAASEQRPPYVVVGAMTLLVLLIWRLFFRRSQKLPLPYYHVKDSVVATLEEAHREVRQAESSIKYFLLNT